MKYEPLKSLKEFEEFIIKETILKLIKDPLGELNGYQGYIIKNVCKFTWYPGTERLVINNNQWDEIVVCLSNFRVLLSWDYEDDKVLYVALCKK